MHSRSQSTFTQSFKFPTPGEKNRLNLFVHYVPPSWTHLASKVCFQGREVLLPLEYGVQRCEEVCLLLAREDVDFIGTEDTQCVR